MSPPPNRTYTFQRIRLSVLEFLPSIRELSSMQEVMTLDAEDHRLPLSRNHDVFPSLLSFHVFEFPDVMYLEVSPGISTTFANARCQSLC